MTKHQNTLLSWMIECAEDSESDYVHLVHFEMVMSLAAIHTSQINAVDVLAAHPEDIEKMREEIPKVAREDGGGQKTSYVKLRMLDSFMKESQRFNPPSILFYHRFMQESHVPDGIGLPKGSHICIPVNAIQNDPEVTPDPEVFDGLDYHKFRQRQGEGHLHHYAITDKNLLSFGHGKYACLGRFFASLEIKVILVRLIMNYELKLSSPSRKACESQSARIFISEP